MANLGNPKNTIEIIQKYEFMSSRKNLVTNFSD